VERVADEPLQQRQLLLHGHARLGARLEPQRVARAGQLLLDELGHCALHPCHRSAQFRLRQPLGLGKGLTVRRLLRLRHRRSDLRGALLLRRAHATPVALVVAHGVGLRAWVTVLGLLGLAVIALALASPRRCLEQR